MEGNMNEEKSTNLRQNTNLNTMYKEIRNNSNLMQGTSTTSANTANPSTNKQYSPMNNSTNNSMNLNYNSSLNNLGNQSNSNNTIMDNTMYLQGFLRQQIGKLVRIQFLIGTNSMQDRTGILTQVGASYVVLRSLETGTDVLCDLYSIKFVVISNQQIGMYGNTFTL